MTDITERLRSRFCATMLDEDAARVIETLRAERDRAMKASTAVAATPALAGMSNLKEKEDTRNARR